MRNAVLTHRPESFAPVTERIARTARERQEACGSAIRAAVERLDACEPGRKFTPADVAADLASHGQVRQLRSIDGWLRQEARAASGRVVRLATRVYVARSGPGAGSIDPAQRVLAAARDLERLQGPAASVQELLAHLNAGGAELSQRSVYDGVRRLLDTGHLQRVRWGHYALAAPAAEVDADVDAGDDAGNDASVQAC